MKFESRQPLPDELARTTTGVQNCESGPMADIRDLVELIVSSKTLVANPKKNTGKRTARANQRAPFAVKCGTFPTQRLIEGEDQKIYRRLAARLIGELVPKTTVESMLVDQILGDLWRLRRVEQAERAYFEQIRTSAVARVLRSLSVKELRRVPELVAQERVPLADDVEAISCAVKRKLEAAVDPDKLMLDGVVSPDIAFPYSSLEHIRRSLVRAIMCKNAFLRERQNRDDG